MCRMEGPGMEQQKSGGTDHPVSPAVRGADVPHHRKKGGIIMGDEQKYKTTISNVRWLAYDIPGNIGWKVFFKKEMAENPFEKLWGKPEDYHLEDAR